MATISEFQLTPHCKFTIEEYSFGKEAYLEYIEEQCDPYYSDTETSVKIDKEQALKIIKLLAEVHGLKISIKGE